MPGPYEIIDPRFQTYVMGNATLEKLGEGFRWAEGPVWFGDLDLLLFSDVPGDRVMCWSPRCGVTVLKEPSGYANGHTRDREGRLLTCSHGWRGIFRTEYDGRTVALATSYRGKRLNSPNDLVVKSDGTIWFTDPNYGITGDYQGERAAQELPCNVYRLDARTGELAVAADDFEEPNGLCFSPDESRLYVAETGAPSGEPRPHIRVFDVVNGQRLANGRVFHTFDTGNADGFRCDEHGNVWCGAADGVHCISADGGLIGKIRLPSAVANVTFGGPKKNRLFICASQSLYALFVNTRGVQWP